MDEDMRDLLSWRNELLEKIANELVAIRIALEKLSDK